MLHINIHGYLCDHMKRTFPILILLLFANDSIAQVESDKALHFLGGNLYGLAGAGIAKQISDGNRWWTFAGAIGGSALIGIGKEAIDSGQENNRWDNKDLLATILGGATVGITIDVFTDHKKKRKKAIRNYTFIKETEIPRQQFRLDRILENQKQPSLTALALPEALILE